MIAMQPFDGGDPVEMELEGRGTKAVLRLWVDADGEAVLQDMVTEIRRQTADTAVLRDAE